MASSYRGVALLVLAAALVGLHPAAADAFSERAENRRIAADFARHHHGYRVVRVFRSLLAPPGDWASVQWLQRGSGGSYAAAGAAYYHNGKPVSKPSRNVSETLGVVPLYKVLSSGEGSYVFVEEEEQQGGTSEISTWTINFRWSREYHPLDLTLNNAAEESHVVITGTGTLVASDPGGPGPSESCTFTLDANTVTNEVGSFSMLYVPIDHGQAFEFGEGIDKFGIASQSSPSCRVNAPLDPQPAESSLASGAGFLRTFTVPVQLNRWVPMTFHSQLQHQGNNAKLSMSGTDQFVLVGIAT